MEQIKEKEKKSIMIRNFIIRRDKIINNQEIKKRNKNGNNVF